MRGAALAHFSRAVRDILNNAYHARLIGRGGPSAWPQRSPDLNPLDFHPWEHLNSLVCAAPVDNERHIALWVPVRLSATAPASSVDAAVHYETCRGVR
jgi:hypothetical protein